MDALRRSKFFVGQSLVSLNWPRSREYFALIKKSLDHMGSSANSVLCEVTHRATADLYGWAKPHAILMGQVARQLSAKGRVDDRCSRGEEPTNHYHEPTTNHPAAHHCGPGAVPSQPGAHHCGLPAAVKARVAGRGRAITRASSCRATEQPSCTLRPCLRAPTAAGRALGRREAVHRAKIAFATSFPAPWTSQRDQPPHTTAKVHLVEKKEALKKQAHAEGTRLSHPPQAVSTHCVEWGLEPVVPTNIGAISHESEQSTFRV